MDEECPICLEPLKGTIVHLDCCKQKLHIQCYVNKCPFCRAELPAPHVIVPVPVTVTVREEPRHVVQRILPSVIALCGLTGFLSILIFSQHR